MNFRRFITLVGKNGAFILTFFFGVALASLWFKLNFMSAVIPGSKEEVNFEVAKGSMPDTIFEQLEKNNLVKHWYAISFFGKFRKNQAGQINILAGEYSLSPGQTPKEILAVLVGGKIVQHPITIPEGLNKNEVAKLIAESRLVSAEDVEKAMNDKAMFAKFGIPANSPEGYLFPETYNFSRPVTAEQIVSRIIDEGQKKLDLKLKGWKEKAKDIGYQPYEILILASIIEKETGSAEERRTIASVFHNRLRLDMPLQSDPTVIYGIPNFNGNITKEDLKTPSPYNTYLNTGLPPTPICNPGIKAIEAVLFPADTDYLYFVAKGDGTHKFSMTYKEQQQAVKQYQKNN